MITKEQSEQVINNLHHVEALMVHAAETLCNKKDDEPKVNTCVYANNCLEVAEKAFNLRMAYMQELMAYMQELQDPNEVKQ